MWANNSAAMSRYQAASSQATTALSQFNSPLSITNPSGTANQQAAVSNSLLSSSGSSTSSIINALGVTPFDPNAGWFSYFSTWGNQFISSGFPINMLGYWRRSPRPRGCKLWAATSVWGSRRARGRWRRR